VAQKAFDTIRNAPKVYYLCNSCGETKAKVFYMNERGFDPVSDGKNGFEYRFFINKKQYLNILDLYCEAFMTVFKSRKVPTPLGLAVELELTLISFVKPCRVERFN
jgi:hypothetical protein